MNDETRVVRMIPFEWALEGKRSGSFDDYEILDDSKKTIDSRKTNNSKEPLGRTAFEQMRSRYATGISPQLPQVTIARVTSRDHVRYVVLAIQVWSEHRDGTDRRIAHTRWFCVPYKDLAGHPVTYESLYDAFSRHTLELPPPEAVVVPALDPRAVVPSTSETLSAAKSAAALLMTGEPVCVTGAEGVSMRERLRFLDTVAALLPYGMRAGLTAATWISSTAWDSSPAKYKIRLFFARHAPGGAHPIAWGKQAEIPANAAELARSYFDAFGSSDVPLPQVIGSLAQQTKSLSFIDSDHRDEALRLLKHACRPSQQHDTRPQPEEIYSAGDPDWVPVSPESVPVEIQHPGKPTEILPESMRHLTQDKKPTRLTWHQRLGKKLSHPLPWLFTAMVAAAVAALLIVFLPDRDAAPSEGPVAAPPPKIYVQASAESTESYVAHFIGEALQHEGYEAVADDVDETNPIGLRIEPTVVITYDLDILRLLRHGDVPATTSEKLRDLLSTALTEQHLTKVAALPWVSRDVLLFDSGQITRKDLEADLKDGATPVDVLVPENFGQGFEDELKQHYPGLRLHPTPAQDLMRELRQKTATAAIMPGDRDFEDYRRSDLLRDRLPKRQLIVIANTSVDVTLRSILTRISGHLDQKSIETGRNNPQQAAKDLADRVYQQQAAEQNASIIVATDTPQEPGLSFKTILMILAMAALAICGVLLFFRFFRLPDRLPDRLPESSGRSQRKGQHHRKET
ncbi:hypothetical protein ACFHYQ_17530 [Sphaerimonospora cavernae]|uniref:Uncharacterized protein n=1 Tax=Sphaerimonospora cavernae TaxID=1740611 RepID=A0ABV6U6M4_9ACTN